MYRVLSQLSRSFSNATPYYRVSSKSTPNMIHNLSSSLSSSLSSRYNTGFVCESSSQLRHTIPNVSSVSNIIYNNKARSSKDILYSKQHNIQQYVVANHSELNRIHAILPNAIFWVKTKITPEGVEESKKMIDYIWEHKCLYNGIYYDMKQFSNGHLPAPVYSHKIALNYICRNVFPYLDELGLHTDAIHINGTNEVNNMQNMINLFSILQEHNILQLLYKRGISLQFSLNFLFRNQIV